MGVASGAGARAGESACCFQYESKQWSEGGETGGDDSDVEFDAKILSVYRQYRALLGTIHVPYLIGIVARRC
jgi:hypothetical protein